MTIDTPDFLRMLDAIEAAMAETETYRQVMMDRISEIRAAVADGKSLRSTLEPHGNRLPLINCLDRIISTWSQAAVELRTAEAEALHGEGLTMEEIAERFGVTRQRISQILQENSD